MGVMDKFLNYMKLNDEDDDDYLDDDYLDDEEDLAPAPKKYAPAKAKQMPKEEEEYEERALKRAPQPKVTPIRQSVTRRMPGTGMEVCVIKPTNVDDAREITETLLSGSTVILNLEGLDLEVAQRIIDFTSGATFAINGNLQKISNYIFLVTPTNVDISGDLQDLLNSSFDVPSIKTRY